MKVASTLLIQGPQFPQPDLVPRPQTRLHCTIPLQPFNSEEFCRNSLLEVKFYLFDSRHGMNSINLSIRDLLHLCPGRLTLGRRFAFATSFHCLEDRNRMMSLSFWFLLLMRPPLK